MIQVPAQASVFMMHEAVSFRNGIDGMAALARQVMGEDPMSGALFVYRNRGRHMLRVLFYDGGGFWLCTRRLSKGTFSSWPTGDGTQPCSPLLARDLQILIWGGDPTSCAFPDLWRRVAERRTPSSPRVAVGSRSAIGREPDTRLWRPGERSAVAPLSSMSPGP
jgi:hypothetical protein